MSSYQYRVVPAPTKGQKVKGLKTPEDRFAQTLEDLMNQMGAEGWEYQRAETLPSVERAGLTGSTTEWRNVLVFRRKESDAAILGDVANLFASSQDAQMGKAEPLLRGKEEASGAPEDTKAAKENTSDSATDQDEDRPAGQPGAVKMLIDNGVEEASEVSGMTNTLKTLATRRFSSKQTG